MPTQAAPTFPKLTGRVVDQAGLLSSQAETKLSALLAQHEQATSNQVVVVTINSLQGYPIENFGYQLGRYWGVGQMGRDNGVLLLVAPTERKVRIEVGYGLEGTLTDAASKNIIDTVITPRFKQKDMEGGITDGLHAILDTIEGTYEPQKSSRSISHVSSAFDYFGAIVIIVMVFGGIVRRIIGNRFLASAVLAVIAGAVGALVFSMALGIFVGIAVFLIQLFTGLGGGDGFGGGGYSNGVGYYGGGYSSSSSGGGFSGGGGGFGGGGASGDW